MSIQPGWLGFSTLDPVTCCILLRSWRLLGAGTSDSPPLTSWSWPWVSEILTFLRPCDFPALDFSPFLCAACRAAVWNLSTDCSMSSKCCDYFEMMEVIKWWNGANSLSNSCDFQTICYVLGTVLY
jgi:hypothetical protein